MSHMPHSPKSTPSSHARARTGGKLYTVFSAPDYPQFTAPDEERHNNLAAVAVLRGPGWNDPDMVQYGAVHPRPPATPYYDIGLPGSGGWVWVCAWVGLCLHVCGWMQVADAAWLNGRCHPSIQTNDSSPLWLPMLPMLLMLLLLLLPVLLPWCADEEIEFVGSETSFGGSDLSAEGAPPSEADADSVYESPLGSVPGSTSPSEGAAARALASPLSSGGEASPPHKRRATGSPLRVGGAASAGQRAAELPGDLSREEAGHGGSGALAAAGTVANAAAGGGWVGAAQVGDGGGCELPDGGSAAVQTVSLVGETAAAREELPVSQSLSGQVPDTGVGKRIPLTSGGGLLKVSHSTLKKRTAFSPPFFSPK
jgi:hypothetical protein